MPSNVTYTKAKHCGVNVGHVPGDRDLDDRGGGDLWKNIHNTHLIENSHTLRVALVGKLDHALRVVHNIRERIVGGPGLASIV